MKDDAYYYLLIIKGKAGSRAYRLESNLRTPSPLETEIFIQLDDEVEEPLFIVFHYKHLVSAVNFAGSDGVKPQLGGFYMILMPHDYDPEEDDPEFEVDDPEMYWRCMEQQGWEHISW